jgi:cobalamin biosynthetic protein CobC
MRHGGDIDEAERQFGRQQEGWIDLSTGINPMPYPTSSLASMAWNRLPTATDLAGLIEIARQAYGAPAEAELVVAAGSQAILQVLPTMFPGRNAAFVAPAYAGYREAWAGAGEGMACIVEPDPGAADVLVLGQPNNPDGSVWPKDLLLRVAAELAARDGLLVVDEAFADAAPGASLAPKAAQPGLLVLRSFGKFFGLAGLRLGFAIAEATFAERLAARLGPWPVAGPAIAIGSRALADTSWIAATRVRLEKQAERLDSLLRSADLTVIGGTPLFRLVECRRAETLHTRLAQAGIWTRRFDEHPSWLRFGLPGRDRDWARLVDALRVTDEISGPPAPCPASTSAA